MRQVLYEFSYIIRSGSTIDCTSQDELLAVASPRPGLIVEIKCKGKRQRISMPMISIGLLAGEMIHERTPHID
jgi:hypothetical protein